MHNTIKRSSLRTLGVMTVLAGLLAVAAPAVAAPGAPGGLLVCTGATATVTPREDPPPSGLGLPFVNQSRYAHWSFIDPAPGLAPTCTAAYRNAAGLPVVEGIDLIKADGVLVGWCGFSSGTGFDPNESGDGNQADEYTINGGEADRIEWLGGAGTTDLLSVNWASVGTQLHVNGGHNGVTFVPGSGPDGVGGLWQAEVNAQGGQGCLTNDGKTFAIQIVAVFT